MTVRVEVAGGPAERETGSVVIRKALAARSTADVTLVDRLGTAVYQRGQQLDILLTADPVLVETLYPNGAGATTALTPFPGPPNWDCVDEEPPDDTDLVYADSLEVAYIHDLYALTNHAVTTLVPLWVRTVARCSSNIGTPVAASLQLAIRSGGVNAYSPEFVLAPAWARYEYIWYTNPVTLADWTPAEIDALQAGPRMHRADRGGGIFTDSFCSQFKVEVGWGVRKLFSGQITKAERQALPNGPTLYHVTCRDWSGLADKRLAAESYPAQTAGFIVDDLFDKYLAAEGVTIGEIQAGVTLTEFVINYQMVSTAFDALAEASDYIWYIDEEKRLYFVARATTPAPFTVTKRELTRLSPRRTVEAPQYRNRQYIRAGKATTALQTENRTGDDETQAFAMGYSLVSAPTITVGGAAQTVGIKGIDTARDWYWSKGDPVVTAAVAPGVGAAIVVAYYGEYNILVLVEDAGKIAARQAIEGGTGIDDGIDEAADLNTLDGALELAQSKLDYFGQEADTFSFRTVEHGLAPGQLLTVIDADYGLASAQLLIESVEISELAKGTLLYTVRAVTGPASDDWTKTLATLAARPSIRLGNDLLIILHREPGDWAWNELVTQTVVACPVPGAGVFPALTLYPC